MADPVAERQHVAVAIADGEIAQSPRAVARFLQNLHAVRVMECIQLVRVADDEINRQPFGARRALLEKDLHVAEVHAGHRGGSPHVNVVKKPSFAR